VALPSEHVWVFVGNEASFPGAVFHTQSEAEAWIAAHRLSGVLTRYPVGVGVYDQAVEDGTFTPTRAHHRTPEFIGGFTSGHQPHHHYTDGSP
jgi:hypothetical protein